VDATSGAAPLRVMALLGSLRAKALSRGVLNAALELAPAGLSVTHHAQIGELPFFNQDVEDVADPASVTAFKAALNAADALLLVSPEYNSGTSAVLKNAIDWASRGKSPLKGMPVGLITSSPGPLGGVRCQIQLRQTLHGIGAMVMPAPDVLIGSAGQKIDGSLRLTDETTRNFSGDYLARFERFARAHRSLLTA